MKRIFCLLMLGEALLAFGQTPANRLKIGVVVSPDVCYRKLYGNTYLYGIKNIIDEYNKMQAPKPSYSVGIDAQYQLRSKISLSIGAQYANKGYQSNKKFWDNLVFPDQIDSTGIHPAPSPIYSVSLSERKYHYIDVPVKIIYSFGEKRLRGMAATGLIANIFLHNGAFSSPTIYLIEGGRYNRVTLSPMVQAGVSYDISDRMTLQIAPTFQYSLTPVRKLIVREYLYSGGLQIGCFMRL